MTKKDFELIAKTINSLRIYTYTQAEIARTFADALTPTSPRFDRDRFIAAATATEVTS